MTDIELIAHLLNVPLEDVARVSGQPHEPRFREFVHPRPRLCTCPNPANYHEVGRKSCLTTKVTRVLRWLTGQR